MNDFLKDLKHALRMLAKNPGFTAVALLTLALGIGANTAIFSVVKAVLLNQLPYRQPGRLVAIAEAAPSTVNPVTVDFTTEYDWRMRSRSFERMSLYRPWDNALTEGGEPELINGLRVSYNFFDTLGVKVQMGRTFRPEDDTKDRWHVLILSHGLWLRRFGGDPNVLGRVVHLDEASFTIVGVLTANFRPIPLSRADPPIEMFAPLGYELGQWQACRGCQHLRAVARLKPEVSAGASSAELNTIMRDIMREHPDSYDAGEKVVVTPLRDLVVGSVSRALWVLLGAVGLVLLIACANIANLLLARSTGRFKELALRAALGASRPRLIRQLLGESMVLAIAGGALGIVLAAWGTWLLASFSPKEIPRVQELQMDVPVLLFGMAASLLAGLVFGAAPALRASRVDLNDALKDVGKSTAGRAKHRLRNVLVMGELALAFVLVAGAGLLGKSFLNLMNVDAGFDTHNLLTLETYVYGQRYKKPEAELGYYKQAMDRLRATPGIAGVAMVSTLPLSSNFDGAGFHIQDRRLPNSANAASVDRYSVSPDYFRVMRIPLKRGRVFTEQDRQGAPLAAIISESCTRSQFAHEDAIGKHIQLGGRHDDKPWATIVGVVGDVHQWGLDRPARMAAYIPQAQDLSFSYVLVARTTVDPRRMESAARDAFLAADKTLPVFNIEPMEGFLEASLSERTFTLILLALFGTLALALAAVGIYGVISYAVSLRTREIGIRMALGAERRGVLAMVLWQGATLAGVGLAVGWAASLVLTRSLGSLLWEVRPWDLATSGAVAVVLAVVALVASYIPARRATRVDPLVALRYE